MRSHGNNFVDFSITNSLIREKIGTSSKLTLVPGFIASTTTGETTTLGRGGSDYTAAIIAAALGAEVLEIWTDVEGFMTADPKKVEKAYTIENLTYAEAMELSHFGAKVIYTPTLRPVYKAKIPVIVKNTFNPESKGTLINGDVSECRKKSHKGYLLNRPYRPSNIAGACNGRCNRYICKAVRSTGKT